MYMNSLDKIPRCHHGGHGGHGGRGDHGGGHRPRAQAATTGRRDDGTTGLKDGVLENWSGGRMCTEIKEICRRLDEKDGRECFLAGWGVHFGVTAGVNQYQPVSTSDRRILGRKQFLALLGAVGCSWLQLVAGFDSRNRNTKHG